MKDAPIETYVLKSASPVVNSVVGKGLSSNRSLIRESPCPSQALNRTASERTRNIDLYDFFMSVKPLLVQELIEC